MTAKHSTLTAERVRELFYYDRETGVLTRTKVEMRLRPGFRNGLAGWVNLRGYRRITIDGRQYLAHHLAWIHVYGQFPQGQLDHIDGNTGNNAIANLRECSTQQNCSGRSLRKDSSTGFKGVIQEGRNSWTARIGVNYKRVHIGTFKSPVEAAIAYDSAAIKYYGEFARTNASLGLL